MEPQRLQKILSLSGISSRRKAEELIQLGFVTVNGQIAKLGDKAIFGKDAIKVQGKLLNSTHQFVTIAFYKPKKVISMFADPQGRQTLSPYLSSIQEKIFPIGRLDYMTEGLLLLTNDGLLAEKLSKESCSKTYQLKVKGHPDEEMLKRIQTIRFKDFTIERVEVKDNFQSKACIEMEITGTGSFDLRAWVESKGYLVDRVVRTAIGSLRLEPLQPGEHRFIKKAFAYSLVPDIIT